MPELLIAHAVPMVEEIADGLPQLVWQRLTMRIPLANVVKQRP